MSYPTKTSIHCGEFPLRLAFWRHLAPFIRGNRGFPRVPPCDTNRASHSALERFPGPLNVWKEAIEVQVLVRENNVDQALRVLKKKMQREGIFREMKLRRNYEKPSERRARERAEAIRRTRKLMRKRMEREGY